jgi:hypothetical protein
MGVPISNQFVTYKFGGGLTFLYVLIIHLRKKVGLGFMKFVAGGAHLNRPSNYYAPSKFE